MERDRGSPGTLVAGDLREVHRDDFWELHRRLGECYEADMISVSRSAARVPATPATPATPASPRQGTRRDSFEAFLEHRKQRVMSGHRVLSGSLLKRTNQESDGHKSGRSSSIEETPSGGLGASGAQDAQIAPAPPKSAPSQLCHRTLSAESSHTAPVSKDLCSNLEDLQPRSAWLPVEEKAVTKMMHKAASMLSLSATISTVENTNDLPETSQPSCYLLHPSGRGRTIWNLLTVLALVWDIIAIPMEFFDLPNMVLLSVAEWVTIFFWSVDIAFSFITGIYRKGVLVMEPKVVAMAYLRSWFSMDLLLVSFDWLAMATANQQADQMDEDAYRVVWALRLLRLFRIVRLGKMSRTAMNMKEAMHSWATSVQYSIFMNIFLLMLMLHMIACGWWAFGHTWGNADGWSVKYEIEGISLLYSYTTCLHWAISQLGVSSSDIEATNSTERIYSIVVAMVSLVTFSTMVSSMTSMMGTWYAEKEEERKQFNALQRYLKHYTISPGLSQRITHFLQHAASQRKATVSDLHVPLLELLSKPLRGELQLEKFCQSMKENAFLYALLHCDNVTVLDVMRSLATNAISTLILGGKDVVFRFAMEATASYLPVEGSFSYWQENKPEVKKCEGWAAEMCLWTEWFYVGDLVADTVSSAFVLDVEAFCDRIAGSRVTQKLAVAYANEYVQALHTEDCWTDLWSMDKLPEVQDLFRGRGQEPQLIFNSFARAGTPGVSGSGRFGRGGSGVLGRGGRLSTFTRGVVPLAD